ncbi:UNVERIFIED_CONTAM: pyruvate,water dikinase [Brevibacillus sp. OAP136]|uniref:PEP/pyruvate-binding domain-containing protein n=1 Tax=Brevibacillus fluminis TaxID=511487 RepID=UPI001605D267|nr:PEP/pyruvate-binding domain-containing protein [Brevibacillus fluminis]
MYTVSLEAAFREQKDRIGSKALQLSRLMREHFYIPDGFVITAEALAHFLDVHRMANSADFQDRTERFLQTAIPDEIRAEIAAAYRRLTGSTGCSVAVRSSASAEDLQEASFAGQYETILHVTDFDHLLSAIKRCWLSLFSDQVAHYAATKQLSLTNFPMGILVQQMIAADVSGVVFTMNPVTGSANEIIINASYGLGESIVSGLVTPDSFTVHKHTEQLTKELGPKELKIVPAVRETREMETTESEQTQFCLDDTAVLAIAREAQRIEILYQQPVDIEFAIKEEQLYLLQVRPITT